MLQDSKMIWFNMRQEPVVYINNQPFAPRHPDHVHDNLEVIIRVATKIFKDFGGALC